MYKAVVTLWHIHATAYDATVKMNEAGLMHWCGKKCPRYSILDKDKVFWTTVKKQKG